MKDFRSLEKKIWLLTNGRLTSDGWEKISESTWYHPVADISRVLDEDGNEHIINKKGERVSIDSKSMSVGIPQAKTLHQKLQIQSKIIDEAFPDKKDKKAPKDKPPVPPKEDKDPANDKDNEAGTKTVQTPSKNTEFETSNRSDPKEIKGGKTQVDLHPSTDEKPAEDESNAGAKKKPVKESKNVDPDKVHISIKDVPKNKVRTDFRSKEHKKDDAWNRFLDGKTNRRPGVRKKPVKEGVVLDIAQSAATSAIGSAMGKLAYDKAKTAIQKIKDKRKANKDSEVKEESLDELSDTVLNNYIKRAKVSKETAKDSTTYAKRKIGISKASVKKAAPSGKIHKEELFTPDELAYFETVMSEEYVDMSKKSVDSVINAKGKPHKVYTATDETRHGIGVDELKRHMGVGESPHVHKKFMHNLHTAGVRTGWSHSSGKWIAYHGPRI